MSEWPLNEEEVITEPTYLYRPKWCTIRRSFTEPRQDKHFACKVEKAYKIQSIRSFPPITSILHMSILGAEKTKYLKNFFRDFSNDKRKNTHTRKNSGREAQHLFDVAFQPKKPRGHYNHRHATGRHQLLFHRSTTLHHLWVLNPILW